MTDGEKATLDPKAAVVEAVRKETGGLSVDQLVQSLQTSKRLSADQTYEGVRRATQHGELRFDSKMKLVLTK